MAFIFYNDSVFKGKPHVLVMIGESHQTQEIHGGGDGV